MGPVLELVVAVRSSGPGGWRYPHITTALSQTAIVSEASLSAHSSPVEAYSLINSCLYQLAVISYFFPTHPPSSDFPLVGKLRKSMTQNMKLVKTLKSLNEAELLFNITSEQKQLS